MKISLFCATVFLLVALSNGAARQRYSTKEVVNKLKTKSESIKCYTCTGCSDASKLTEGTKKDCEGDEFKTRYNFLEPPKAHKEFIKKQPGLLSDFDNFCHVVGKSDDAADKEKWKDDICSKYYGPDKKECEGLGPLKCMKPDVSLKDVLEKMFKDVAKTYYKPHCSITIGAYGVSERGCLTDFVDQYSRNADGKCGDIKYNQGALRSITCWCDGAGCNFGSTLRSNYALGMIITIAVVIFNSKLLF